MPHSVSWCIEKNSLGTSIPTCTCSLHASGGYPCRHIISVAVARREKIKTSFFNDRLEKDQVPFIEGRKLASVNYLAVQRSMPAPVASRQLDSSGTCGGEHVSEQKRLQDKLIGWANSMIASNNTTFSSHLPPQASESSSTAAAVKVMQLLCSMKALDTPAMRTAQVMTS